MPDFAHSGCPASQTHSRVRSQHRGEYLSEHGLEEKSEGEATGFYASMFELHLERADASH